LVGAGASVVAFARTEAALDGLINELRDAAVAVCGDVRNAADIARAVEAAQHRFGKLDTLVYCIGTILLKPLQSTTEEDWAETLQLNLTSAFRTIKTALPAP
jgi:NADP-dependent 3-hydroxy acid dehydrogenase YdfG